MPGSLASDLSRDLAADEFADRLKRPGFPGAESRYALLRFVLLRGLGLVYWVAFLIVVFQFRALCGQDGLLPATDFLSRVAAHLHSRASGFWALPSLFWLGSSDWVLLAAGWLGLLLSAALLAGYANAISMFVLWALYLSFVQVGQVFYGYGWESLLCEAGFLGIFLAAPLDPRPFPARSAAPEMVVVLFRWLTFRVMFGAGLIKIRGDPCWRDLSCLNYHYETQPNPSPLSYYFHRLPPLMHKGGVLFNHFVELLAPFGVFGPRRVRLASGASIVAFQVILILSGNLSFLNWLTLVVALSCFDDGVVSRLFSRSTRARVAALERAALPSAARRGVLALLGIVTGLMSINPLVNLLSPRQTMNASYDPFRLVNTYGAFGSVGRERLEVAIEGTTDQEPSPTSRWLAYELPCYPGDPLRRPCLITPYHYRLDWQMWFVPLGDLQPDPWLVHLVAKLLASDRLVLGLFRSNPFPIGPPRFVRVALYRYRFTRAGEPGWWHREYLMDVIRPISLRDPELQNYLSRAGLR